MARPSSSTSSDGTDTAGGLFGPVAFRGAARGETDDRAWLQAMLDAEAALARAEARAGLFSAADAEAIAAACRAELFDAGSIGAAATAEGIPVPALVRALTAKVRDTSGEAAAGQVHRGATSQDILDTAAMLVARRALGPILGDLSGAADAAAALAERHRATPMAARTLLQQALPTTFGLIAATWLSGLDRAAGRLDVVRGDLAVQLGGAAGTLASLGDAGPAIVGAYAAALGLAEPELPWHTERTRVGELAGALGEAAGATGKAALDVVLLAETEVGEVREGTAGRGGSSALPQKRNPVAAVAARAAAIRAPGLVATLLATAHQELQRGAGPWQAEAPSLSELLATVGSSAAWLRDCLEHLEIDSGRMRRNLEATGGLLLAERVAAALQASAGRLAAHDAVAEAAAETKADGRTFAEALVARPEIDGRLGRDEIDRLLDAEGYLGSATVLVDRALARHRAIGPRANGAPANGTRG